MNKEQMYLIAIEPYREDDQWYMKLIYEIKREDGSIVHRVIPKVQCPFYHTDIDIREQPYMYTDPVRKLMLYDNYALVYPGRVKGYITGSGDRVNVDKVLYTDILIKKPDTREMTLADIEKELGYPVKIVRGEE